MYIKHKNGLLDTWEDNEINRKRVVAWGLEIYVGDVEVGFDGNTYAKGYAPIKPKPTKEEVSAKRKQYRKDNIDDETARRARKIANGTWTDNDEEDYLLLDQLVEEYIVINFPYPIEVLDEPTNAE